MNTEIYNIVKAKITTSDLDAFKKLATKMVNVSKDEPGTLVYDFFINEKKKEALIIEKYANGDALMAHMKKFTQSEFIPTLLTMQKLTSVEMAGTITDNIKEFFNKNKFTYNAYPINFE
tara:strand:- start:256 stop:612 length:357 start_codon:yes stop_codon:yes gene_type:complete